jgi:hypothetical protein
MARAAIQGEAAVRADDNDEHVSRSRGETDQVTEAPSGDDRADAAESSTDPLQDPDSPAYRHRYGYEAGMVVGAAEGRPLAQIAAMSGVSISTVQRRLREPRMQALINDAQRQQLSQAFGQVLALLPCAIDILQTGLAAESASVRFRSAEALLRTTFKLAGDLGVRRQITDLADQVHRLHQLAGDPADESDVLEELADPARKEGGDV